MNKELIKKYRDEFNHWLNGGEIAVKYRGAGIYVGNPGNLVAFNWSNPENIESIVIKDKYVEFRKSIVQGKQVQVYVDDVWVDIDSSSYDFNNLPLDQVRVKPDIKVGDWIIDREEMHLEQQKILSLMVLDILFLKNGNL